MKRYLEDVEPRDILYNFLEGNKPYKVVEVRKDRVLVESEDGRYALVEKNGCAEVVPHFLYTPVEVLDPRNLPERPWKPRKGEWVWVKGKEWRTWALRRFKGMDKEGVYVCTNVYDSGTELFYEVAPFKGKLPPRPWKPKKGEWVWAKRPKTGWVLAKFVSRNPHNEDYLYWCILQEKPGKLAFSEVAPFKGELPPGLEDEDAE